ncbi:hypothetical protein QTP70_004303 [Hemibagrus guttatus]|uniref:Proline-rich protein 15-like protein A n=1 Tax=Hemibagrus guttatus TaxID=175788 RepID=A0AAE0QF50_9TELE|nr:hypothetical protein QTP70_004303 [Hemibagrus guttatus]KAK3552619.1 hypothetical protein QTP86_017908 [Hemibagrus guttatus]
MDTVLAACKWMWAKEVGVQMHACGSDRSMQGMFMTSRTADIAQLYACINSILKAPFNPRAHHSLAMATAEPAPAWWKLTFLRKKKSEAKELYEVPEEYSNNAETAPGTSSTTGTPDDSQFNARLERIVDKTATKGRHVKVSHSGRFKEKKRIRSTLAENPELFPNQDTCNGNQSTGN